MVAHVQTAHESLRRRAHRHEYGRQIAGPRVLSKALHALSSGAREVLIGYAARILAVTALALTIGCGGCTNRPSQGVLLPVAENVEGTSRVLVLAVTTRQKSTDVGEMFNGERAENVSFAAVTVSIPPDSVRKVGEIQWPASLPGDPHRDFVTVSANYLERQSFSDALMTTAKRAGHGKVLVFVHGFNNRFDDAAYRLAQIAHDSKAQAIPVLFTWPSKGELELRAYTYDRDSATYSRDALEGLLDLLARHPSVTEVTVLAHSMGNWVTLETLRALSLRTGRIGAKIKSVMLVAPDVDVDIFRTQIGRMGTPRPYFELFVSRDDEALKLSQFIWGGAPRLGEVDPSTEPYRREFEQQRIEVFDLTRLKAPGDDAHDRAFEDITSVTTMIRKRLGEGQQLAQPHVNALPSFSNIPLIRVNPHGPSTRTHPTETSLSSYLTNGFLPRDRAKSSSQVLFVGLSPSRRAGEHSTFQIFLK